MTHVTNVAGTAAPETETTPVVLTWREIYRPLDVPTSDDLADIDEYVDRLERDPVRRAGIARARVRLADRLSHRLGGLADLRMRRGLSQKQLAQAIGTSQPHIARIEGGRDNVLLATANDLARALDVPLEEINEALGYKGARK